MGFTLIEVAITVSILGIIASIAIPKFTSHYHRIKLKSSSERLAKGLDMAEAYSKLDPLGCDLRLIETHGIISGYQVGQFLTNDGILTPQTMLRESDSIESTLAITVDGEVRTIRFTPNSDLHFLNKDGKTVTLSVCTVHLKTQENVTSDLMIYSKSKGHTLVLQ